MATEKKKAKSFSRRYYMITAAALFSFALATGFYQPTPSFAASPVKTMVSKFGTQVLTILGNRHSARKQKEQFRTVFLRNADIGAIARFTLGKYARIITPTQKVELHKLLGQYIVQLFVVKMRGTQSTGLEVLGITEIKKDLKYLVKSVIKIRKEPGFSDAPIPVKWRIYRNKSGELKLTDISIGGFWLAQAQRSTFVDIISSNRGKISALLTHLRQEVSQ